MPARDLAFTPAHRLAPEIASGRLSPVAVVEACLDRIARQDATLHAFVATYGDDARLAAEGAASAIRAGHRIGPLHGIPVALKDLIDIEGKVATGGSMAWRDRVAPATATVVNRLVAAGMIVLGKTHTVEFAYGGWGTNERMGTPWNPWDLETHRVPGGSSAGSGVAVAAGMATTAIGTDTGGSVRIPAGFCGIVGLKTTVGRISTHGVLPLCHTLDTVGPMTRSVEDAATMFNALQGPDPFHPATMVRPIDDPLPTMKRGIAGMNIARLPAVERERIAADVLANYDAALRELERQGARLIEIALPHRFLEYRDMVATIIGAEGYAYVRELVDRPDAPLDRHVRARLEAGKALAAHAYIAALRQREAAKRAFAEAMDGADALVIPTVPTTAIPVAEVDENSTPAEITRMGNLMDLCGLALPTGFGNGGLPTSMQILARGYDETTALRIGWAYEQATEWHEAQPTGL